MRIGISGHRDLTPATVEAVRSEVERVLADHVDGLQGVSCLADGADQLFAQAVVNAGGRLIAVVPAEQYRDGLPAESHAEYDRLLAAAVGVVRLPFVESNSESHMAASVAMLDRIDLLVAVWDGKPARGYGGTADVVAEAERRKIGVTVVWPEGSDRMG